MEPGDKYPEHFRVTLEIAVSAKERPAPGASFPWQQGFSGKGLSPRILFATKEEQEEILNQYGEAHVAVVPLLLALPDSNTLSLNSRNSESTPVRMLMLPTSF